MATLETIPYRGWSRCYRLSNGRIELVITGEVGPRIIRLGFTGQDNLFCEVAEELGQRGGDAWRLYGGHRFWHAPEHPQRTYQPDNNPLEIGEHGGLVRIAQPLEAATGIGKELDLTMSDGAAHVRVTHRLHNHNLWAVTLAPWALSVMTSGGTGVVPLPPRGSHPEDLLPANTLAMWPYSDMSDPRWSWGERYILLRQDPQTTRPQKIGVDVRDGWAAYVVGGSAFVKLFERVEGARYPDLGSNVEMFTNDFMFELETLGPLQALEPGASVEHHEDWFLFDDIETPASDAEVEATLLPLVRQAQAAVAP